jgi:hypothetical protein
MDYAQKTFDDLRKFVFALPAPSYTVRCVPASGSGPTIPVSYTLRQLLASYRYLRCMNAGDHHAFGRPDSTRYILVDDLDQDALDRLDADQLGPSVIIETSKANHQAWVAVSRDEIPAESATAAAKLLARRYGGDLGSAHAQHVGRLPGLRNRKEQYCTAGRYPLCRLVRATEVPKVHSGAACLLDEVAEMVAASPALSPLTRGACVPTPTDTPTSDMTPDEGRDIYAEAVSEFAARFGPMQSQDRSAVDHAVASWCARRRMSEVDIAAVLLHGSAKAAERGRDYAMRTVLSTLSQSRPRKRQ